MTVDAETVVTYLRDIAGRPLRARELARGLEVPAEELGQFRELLRDLEARGALYKVQRQRYAAPAKINLAVGRVQALRSGAAFITREDDGEDVFVPAHGLGSAVDGDRVVVRIERRRGVARPEGRVIEVLERGRRTVVGVYHPSRNFGFVVPEDQKLTRHVFIPPEQEAGAAAGDVVVVRVTSWGDEHRGPAGEVERVLGRLGDPGVDVLAVLMAHELPLEFPEEVEREAEEIRSRGIGRAQTAERLDLRDYNVFTIDPVDARDHDDALSIRRLGDDTWELGVHIADVGAYVEPGGAIDREALRRGTSVYLVDRVVPMLPDALSADLCSLQPGQDRLTVSLLLVLDAEARVRNRRLVRSVIRSRHALSYDRAQAVLDGTESVDPDTDEALGTLAELSRALRRRRLARGSLDFDLPEARVVLGSRGEPTDIQRVLRLESHRLIEDFMLLANETIARMAVRAEIPFLFRVHERPDPDRLLQLRDFAATLGHRLGARNGVAPKDLQGLIEHFSERPEGSLVSAVVLRTMKQARYSDEPLGHFGLAMRHYTHFTSPIRRYPDLVVHRLVTRAFIDREPLPDAGELDLHDVARHTSERERVAVDAERDSTSLKKVEFMERHLGDDFEGTISGVTAFGFFVLLDRFFVEGLVHVSSLEDDYYRHVEERYMLLGERTRRSFRLGDRVRVQVVSVDRESRRIDFRLLEGGNGAGAARARG